MDKWGKRNWYFQEAGAGRQTSGHGAEAEVVLPPATACCVQAAGSGAPDAGRRAWRSALAARRSGAAEARSRLGLACDMATTRRSRRGGEGVANSRLGAVWCGAREAGRWRCLLGSFPSLCWVRSPPNLAQHLGPGRKTTGALKIFLGCA